MCKNRVFRGRMCLRVSVEYLFMYSDAFHHLYILPCTIIDLHDRSVVASITDRHITSDLAIRTLQKALDSQPAVKGELILHSDQGS